jgi:hypothetical protein
VIPGHPEATRFAQHLRLNKDSNQLATLSSFSLELTIAAAAISMFVISKAAKALLILCEKETGQLWESLEGNPAHPTAAVEASAHSSAPTKGCKGEHVAA